MSQIEEKAFPMEMSSQSSLTDVKPVSCSKMIKNALMAGVLLGAITIILGSHYVVQIRSLGSNPSDILKHVELTVESPTSLSTVDLSSQTVFSALEVDAPTVLPTVVLGSPTTKPTVVFASPTSEPSFPSNGYYCTSFATSNTNSVTSNYTVCPITACPDDTVTMTTFSPGSCNGDTYLRLYDPSTGSQLARNDDFNGSLCSQITYRFKASCRTYELREGCYGSGNCDGRVYYTGSSAVSQSPIAIATTMPTVNLAAPTTVPGAPTRKPTVVLGAPTAFPTGTYGAPTQQNIPESERVTLHDLYVSTNGRNWDIYYSPWDFSDPNSNPCTQGWVGVSCSYWYSDGYYHVYMLYLVYRNLVGTIPDSIVNLSYLQNLYLDYNLLFGTIPRSIGQLSSLNYLQLSNNYFTGLIPDLSDRQYSYFGSFDVSNNYLEGSIPLSVFNIPSSLDVKGNLLTGSLPDMIGNMYYLDVSGNNMVGIIPYSLCASNNLREIYLYGNNFQCYHQCLTSNIRYAYVGDTPLCPPVPSSDPAAPTAFPTNVIADPTATPTFPSNGYYCPSFSTSNTNSATSNYAVCSIIACPGETVLMTTFSPGSCNGDIYLRLYDPSTGSELTYNDDYNGSYDDDYSGSSLCSQITYTFTASCRTYELREGCYGSDSCGGVVYYTGSSAVSQSPIAVATTMPTIDLAAPTTVPGSPTRKPTVVLGAPTGFPTGTYGAPTPFPTMVPGAPTAFPTGTYGAPTQQNILESERDALYDLYNSTNGRNWDFDYDSPWDFSDPNSNPCTQYWQGLYCSYWYLDDYYHVYELYLVDRNLVGTIPDSIVNLSYLSYLYLNYNLLFGTIPRSIGQLSQLYSLRLSNNYLTGVIPDLSDRQYSYFGSFDVSNNYLEGSIPLSVFNIPSSLDVKGNLLTGSIPDMIGNLYYLDVSGNNMVGIIPYSLCASNNLQEIYLNGNNFQCYHQCLTSNIRYAYVGDTPLCPPVPSSAPAAPTAFPTNVIAASTAMPTFPSNGYYCPSFATSNTNYATSNYAVCPITACPGDTVLMTTLSPGSCSGDNYLRLYDPSTNSELTVNDDFYGVCSQITYTFTASCRTYELREGCFSSGSCGGQVYYTGSTAVSQSPIAIATTMPSTLAPNFVSPTLRPTSSIPTRKPTTRPSSRSPSSKPTSNPSFRPTRNPTTTRKPTSRPPVKQTPAPSYQQTTIAPTPLRSPRVKPTVVPSRRPSRAPSPTTASPTVKSTPAPSRQRPTTAPTTRPPRAKPTRDPSRRPSRAPSV